jgi:hypothetical protein
MARSEPNLSALDLHDIKHWRPAHFRLRQSGRSLVRTSLPCLNKRPRGKNESDAERRAVVPSMQARTAGWRA